MRYLMFFLILPLIEIQVYFILIVHLNLVQPDFKSSGCHIGPCRCPLWRICAWQGHSRKWLHSTSQRSILHVLSSFLLECSMGHWWLTDSQDQLKVSPWSAHSRSPPCPCLDFSKGQLFYKKTPAFFTQRWKRRDHRKRSHRNEKPKHRNEE